MVTSVKEYKEKHPSLVEKFEKMSREELLEQLYKESIDLVNMVDRTQLLMSECTHMSNVTYTLDVIKELIDERKTSDINWFCYDLVEEAEDFGDEYILLEIKKRSEKILE